MSQATLNEKRFTWRSRPSGPLPLRVLTAVATAGVAAALIFAAATARSQPSIQLAAGPGTTVSILNSKEGLAVLSAGNMRPGDSASGSVTITNTGDGDGVFSLTTSALSDVPGAGAGVLSGKLDLAIVDDTVPAAPVTVYAGKVNAVGTIALGTYAAGEARTYDFTVSFPNGATGAENAYQGASLSVTLDWDAVLAAGAPAPAVAASTPADGATVSSAGSASLDTNIALAAVQSPMLDGSPVGASVSGTDVSFSTGALADGPHTLAGVLQGLDGQTTPFRLHFTVWSSGTDDYPYVEMNSPAGEQIELTSANGAARLTVSASSWSGGASGDWVVFRVDPATAPAATGGLVGDGKLYDVSSYWALALGAVTTYDKAVDLRIPAGSSVVIPAAYAGGSWRRLDAIPSGTALPSGWQDGYYVSGSQVHVLTKSAGAFGLLRDVQAPAKPRSFSGSVSHGHVILKWRAATDNEGVAAYLVYAGGTLLKTLPASARSYHVGRVKASNKRAFSVAARDAAGNVGPRAGAVVAVPSVANLTLKQAKSALVKRGLKAGKVTYVFSSSVAKGRVVRAGKSGVVLQGTAVPLVVSKGARQRPTTGSSGGETGSSSGGSTPTTSPIYPTYPSYPTAPVPTPVLVPATAPPPLSGGEKGEGGALSTGSATGASPQRFTDGGSSGGRRAAGLALLGGLFLSAAGLALHARRGAWPRSQPDPQAAGQLLFWDERLARATLSVVRRLAGLIRL